MTGEGLWRDALLALTALSLDERLKGVVFRVRAGPVRDALDQAIASMAIQTRRIHPALSDSDLFGGLDVAASLATGRAVSRAGLASTPALLVLPMAERTPPGLAARLGHLLDMDAGHRLVLFDEGVEVDEAAPARLCERLAFMVDLSGLRLAECSSHLPDASTLNRAWAMLPRVVTPRGVASQLTRIAADFGIDSLRAPLLALRGARALAALAGAGSVRDDDVRTAAALVYAGRATRLPEETAEQDSPPPAPEDPADGGRDTHTDLPDELLVEAVRACLPAGLLSRLQSGIGAPRGISGSGAGALHSGNRRGRPLPARKGRPDGRARIDLLATLRAAAPWQRLRQRDASGTARPLIRLEDIRLKRFEDRSDRVLVFLVDASGSAAMARLAEAKGAVELLLAQAYARRDHVALIAIRGRRAEVLLPPTRSLVQAKRRLSALPGGGGTPLATGLLESLALAHQARRRGLTPALVLLTDGKANVALDGTGCRERALEDVEKVARQHAGGVPPALLIDISPRPGPEAGRLARLLGAHFVPLPFADATGISRAVAAALPG